MQNISSTILTGLIASILSVIIITLCRKLRSCIRLHPFFGKYYEIDQDGKEHVDIEYELKFRWKNFWSIDDRLILKNISNNPWESETTINHNDPYQSVGIYNYKDVRWGYQKIYFNKKDMKIFIISDFSPCGRFSECKYTIKKCQS